MNTPQTVNPELDARIIDAQLRHSENVNRHNSNNGTARQIARTVGRLFTMVPVELHSIDMASLKLPAPDGDNAEPGPYMHAKYESPAKKKKKHEHHSSHGASEVTIADGVYEPGKRDVYGNSQSKDPTTSVKVDKVTRIFEDVQGVKYRGVDLEASMNRIYSVPAGYSEETKYWTISDTPTIRREAARQLRYARRHVSRARTTSRANSTQLQSSGANQARAQNRGFLSRFRG
ncbi:MAG: hypothetical protein M3Q79_04550 [bacterium]|nr:hypothetical protein [bacterium]